MKIIHCETCAPVNGTRYGSHAKNCPNDKSKKKLAEFHKCNGEAHSNPYIDNCMVCIPWWGHYFTCPIHKTKVAHDSGYCAQCKKYYAFADEVEVPANPGIDETPIKIKLK